MITSDAWTLGLPSGTITMFRLEPPATDADWTTVEMGGQRYDAVKVFETPYECFGISGEHLDLLGAEVTLS